MSKEEENQSIIGPVIVCFLAIITVGVLLYYLGLPMIATITAQADPNFIDRNHFQDVSATIPSYPNATKVQAWIISNNTYAGELVINQTNGVIPYSQNMSLTFTTAWKYATLRVDYYKITSYDGNSGVEVSYQQKIATVNYLISLEEN